MKICNSCSTEYGDQAAYCNICDIDLDSANTIRQKQVLSEDQKTSLSRIKHKLMKIHQLLGGIQAIFLVLMLYSIGFSEGIGSILPILVFSALPALHFFTAQGISKNRSWAHTSSMIIGGVLLIGFPIGTIFGFLILKNLFRSEWDLIKEQ